MSYAYDKLAPIMIQDPITDISAVAGYGVLQSGSQINWKVWSSTSISNTSVVFTTNPPSQETIVDRYTWMQLPVRLTLNGVVRTTNAQFVPPSTGLNSGADAPRLFGLNGSLSTLNATINGDSISVDSTDVIHQLTRFSTDHCLKAKEWSGSPCAYDASLNYGDLIGTNRNPLAPFGTGVEGNVLPRGAGSFTIVSNPVVTPTTQGTAFTAVVDLVLCEPLFALLPFFYGKHSDNIQGFYGVNALNYTLNFLSNSWARMWSHSSAPIATSGGITVTSTITSGSVAFNNFANPAFSYPLQSQPAILHKYITPNQLAKPVNINAGIPYSFTSVLKYPTEIGTLASAQGSVKFSANNLQLSSIPRSLLLLIRPSDSVLQSRCDITDCYLTINQCEIQWCNSPSVLSSASQYQLYQLSVKNGLEMSWPEWSGQPFYNSAFPGTVGSSVFRGAGSILRLEFGTDIQLESNQAPGLNGQYTLQVNLTVQNNNTTGQWDNINFCFYVLTVQEGCFNIVGNSAVHNISVLSKMDVLDAQSRPGMNYRTMENNRGGDFLSTLMDIAKKAHNYVKENKLISGISGLIPHPLAQGISTGAKVLGYGEGRHMRGGDEGGMALYNYNQGGCEDYGMGAYGGMRLNKTQMRKRLMER